MLLRRAVIQGYRSIRQRLEIVFEPTVTVILGPNDHGKTNILRALLHLNNDNPFSPHDDLNWDSPGDASLPSVSAIFELTDQERIWLFDRERQYREDINRRISQAKSTENSSLENEEEDEVAEQAEPAEAKTSSEAKPSKANRKRTVEQVPAKPSEQEDDADDDAVEQLPEEPLPILKNRYELPKTIRVVREGIEGDLRVEVTVASPPVAEELRQFLPRFELIEPIVQVSDSVSADGIARGNNEFMRGIFYYAGLKPDESAYLFQQNDETTMTLSDASSLLDKTLRETWSQGKDLRFQLRHNSLEKTIELLIRDPAVATRFVRASRRSSGFTHYFSLKTILNARRNDHRAHSYVLLFDEPGIYLHPSGQSDLLNVIDTLANESQIVYVTHSLFMINKTYPSRHRLISKDREGTNLNGKPYIGRWDAVLSSLGLSLTGTILFASHVLLTEGDSDPIYLYAVLQKAIRTGERSIQLNPLSIMGTSDSRNTDVIIRFLLESNPAPRIALIFDGDKGGTDRSAYLQALIKDNELPEKILTKDTTLEDHLPMIREAFIPAVADYAAKLSGASGETLLERLQEAYEAEYQQKVTKNLAKWARETARDIAELPSPPSKVGVAREYAIRLADIGDFKLDTRSAALVDWIVDNLKLPTQGHIDQAVLRA